MTVELTPEAVAKMLDEAAGMLAAYQGHPDVADQTIRLLGSSETMTLHEMLSDMFRFIAWAREAVPALAAERDAIAARLAEVMAEWDVTIAAMVRNHVRAEAAEAENARLKNENNGLWNANLRLIKERDEALIRLKE